MKITFVGRHMSVPEDMKLLTEKKLSKFDRYFAAEPDATVRPAANAIVKILKLPSPRAELSSAARPTPRPSALRWITPSIPSTARSAATRRVLPSACAPMLLTIR